MTTKASSRRPSEDEDSFARTRELPNLSFLQKNLHFFRKIHFGRKFNFFLAVES